MRRLLGISFLCLFLLVLSSCTSRRDGHRLFLWKEQEARLYDIPIMLGAVPDYSYQQESDGPQCWIGYTVRASLEIAQNYYVQNMERYGWRYCSAVQGHECMIIFEKPQRLCVISLRPLLKPDQTKVIITQVFLE